MIDFEFIIKKIVEEDKAFAKVGKVTKIARFYRAIKLLRLIRMSELAKEKAKM